MSAIQKILDELTIEAQIVGAPTKFIDIAMVELAAKDARIETLEELLKETVICVEDTDDEEFSDDLRKRIITALETE